ncbi:MAG TPA: LLM class flavin-dependent oxidoreductase [Actinomycetota bacterium]|nr:LLM class flavin-dependent oxidoreductase [Actinomycetota bacterium]
MRVGLALPHYDYSFPDGRPLSWDRLVEAARRAEELGFDSVWVSDHFFANVARYGGPQGLLGTVEPFTALAGLTAATRRVRLGTLVACAPFRHPALVAKMATTIDLVSGGRFDLGLGAGWYEEEFRAFGYGWPSTGRRMAVLEETVEVVTALFRGGPVDFEGRFFRLSGAHNQPPPVQPGGPPVWVGGKGGERGLRLVARHAAGWNTVWRWTPEAYAERVAVLRRIARAEGRDPSTVRLSLGLYALVGEDRSDLRRRYRALQRWTPGGALDGVPLERFAADTLTGTPEECLERLEGLARLGVEEFVASVASLPFAVFDWSAVELFAHAVVPAAHRL